MSNGQNYNGVFLPGFVEQGVEGEPTGIMLVDHIVGNVELGKMNYWCDFYRDVLGFFRYITFDDKDISTEYSALMSIVMSDGGHNIKFPINEPAEGKKANRRSRNTSIFTARPVPSTSLCSAKTSATRSPNYRQTASNS